eukprot:6210378-Pleurochrysis_carterae.AAC.4
MHHELILRPKKVRIRICTAKSGLTRQAENQIVMPACLHIALGNHTFEGSSVVEVVPADSDVRCSVSNNHTTTYVLSVPSCLRDEASVHHIICAQPFASLSISSFERSRSFNDTFLQGM